MSTVYVRFTAHAADTLQRAPLFERLIARASGSACASEWRAEAFRAIAKHEPMPAVASAAFGGSGLFAAGRVGAGTEGEARDTSKDLAAGKDTATSEDSAAVKDTAASKDLVASKDLAASKDTATNEDSAVNKHSATTREGDLLAQGSARAHGAGVGDGGRRGHAGDAWVCMATPLHLTAGMTDVMMQDEPLELNSDEAAALALDFNRVFRDEKVRLAAGRGGVLLCVFDRELDVVTRDPDDMVGCDVFGFQASGRDAGRLRRLMSEMEMWLFDHAVNRVRTARRAAAISSLWLWGGGPVLKVLPRVRGWTAGRDPLFSAFGTVEEAGAASGVVVCEIAPGSIAWPDVEGRWLAPALAALRVGRIECLALSMGGLRFDVRKGWRRRFWRRVEPWWESFELGRG